MTADELQQRIKDPEVFGIKTINVLRDKAGNLPNNYQSGPTCGIYGLHAALLLRGHYAPSNIPLARKNLFNTDEYKVQRKAWKAAGRPSEVSFRGWAKKEGLSQIGEISGPLDLAAIAAGFGFETEAKQFASSFDLWDLVKNSINQDKSIVFPYHCNDDGSPAWAQANGFTHWCLLCGYVEYDTGPRSIVLTTYGAFFEVPPPGLFVSNIRIQPWPAQKWIKIVPWYKNPGDDWYNGAMEWMAKETAETTLLSYCQVIKKVSPGVGYAIGKNSDNRVVLMESSGKEYPDRIVKANIKLAIAKSVLVTASNYPVTMHGRCLVV